MSNKRNIEQEVYFAIGQASMCWSEIPAGVFDSDKASQIASELIEVIKKDTKTSTEVIANSIHIDNDLYFAYQSNIAMQFYDEVKRKKVDINYELLHEISNNAAKNFLDLFINMSNIKNQFAQSRNVLFEKIMKTL